jgi:phage head maturation protease
MPVSRSFRRSVDFTTQRSGAVDGAYTIKGHAAVFGEPSDFGYFTEYMAPGAFEKAR